MDARMSLFGNPAPAEVPKHLISADTMIADSAKMLSEAEDAPEPAERRTRIADAGA
ncbi:hypothetical protein [Nonomuraea sp. NPDC049400]|uniref:hypothetical protein n=1 Tax=Nonomuraea sp. NPDC049400 TaxID=3364352 RepID=UPI00378F8FB7